MKSIEKILLIVVLLSVICKLLHLPFAGLFLFVSTSSLALMYLLGAWYFFPMSKPVKNVFLSTVSGIILFICLMGILFKLQLWPFATILVWMGSFFGLGLFGMLLLLFLSNRKAEVNGRYYYSNLCIRAASVIGICVALAFVPIRTLSSLYHPDDPKYVRLFTKAYESNDEKEWEEFNRYRKSKDY